MRQRVGKDSQERLIGSLLIEPSHRLLVNKIGSVLLAVLITIAVHRMINVVLQNNTTHFGITSRTTVFIQEVGIIKVCLELTDIAIVFIYATLVGCTGRTFITTGPLTEHTGGVAFLLHYLGNDDVVRGIRLLPHTCIVCVLAVCNAAGPWPILLVASHMCVAGVLTCHERGTRRRRDGTAGISLSETHSLGSHTVEVGSSNQLLTIATQIAPTHVITHYIYYIRLALCTGGQCGESTDATKNKFLLHIFIVS